MIRVPITLDRVPITTPGDKFQTIASYNQFYEPYEVMGTYPSVKSARDHYRDDIDEMRKINPDYHHYAIKQVSEENK